MTFQNELDRVLKSPLFMWAGIATIIIVAALLLLPSFSNAATYTGIPVGDFNNLESEIQSLQARVNTLEARVQMLQNQNGAVGSVVTPGLPNTGVVNVGTPGTYAPVTTYGPVIIDQNGGQYNAGWDIFFTGRGFAPNEAVLITSGGSLVGQVRADAGGNISSRGVYLPLGPHTYVFSGQSSGVTAVANVTGVSDVLR
jgi:hypothetical protein